MTQWILLFFREFHRINFRTYNRLYSEKYISYAFLTELLYSHPQWQRLLTVMFLCIQKYSIYIHIYCSQNIPETFYIPLNRIHRKTCVYTHSQIYQFLGYITYICIQLYFLNLLPSTHGSILQTYIQSSKPFFFHLLGLGIYLKEKGLALALWGQEQHVHFTL